MGQNLDNLKANKIEIVQSTKLSVSSFDLQNILQRYNCIIQTN